MPSRTNVAPLCIGVIATVLAAPSCTDSGAPAERIPTYHEDVAPILAGHCATCHHEGGIAPFALVDYEHARTYADAIRVATANRTMPPFVLDNSGACNTYVEARWLSDQQIRTLGDWARAGSPEGDPAKGIVVEPPPSRELDKVDYTLAMETTYTPDAALFDDYRCFVIDPGLTEDMFITAFNVRPGKPQMLHHLTLFAIDSEAAEKEAEAIDAAEAGLGYSCIDELRIEDTRWLVGSGPGSGPLRLPEGTGLRMKAGRKTLLQIHYNQENGIFDDLTQIDMTLEKTVPREAAVRRVANTELSLPPMQRGVEQTAVVPVPRRLTLWGLWPHMHKLGVSMQVTAFRGAQETCLAHVDRWSFHWQGFAHYTKPLTVERGDRMRITCTYDTIGRDQMTTWGQGTQDEMCIAFFYMTDG